MNAIIDGINESSVEALHESASLKNGSSVKVTSRKAYNLTARGGVSLDNEVMTVLAGPDIHDQLVVGNGNGIFMVYTKSVTKATKKVKFTPTAAQKAVVNRWIRNTASYVSYSDRSAQEAAALKAVESAWGKLKKGLKGLSDEEVSAARSAFFKNVATTVSKAANG